MTENGSIFYSLTKTQRRPFQAAGLYNHHMEIFGKKYDIEKILVILIATPFALVALAYAILLIIFSLPL